MYDKSEQKYGSSVTKSERLKYSELKAPSKKQDHHSKFLYKKFEDLVNVQHDHGGKMDLKRMENKQLSYWVENKRKFYRQLLRDEYTPPTPERKSAFENIGFVWTL